MTPDTPLLSIRNLTVTYGRGEAGVVAVDDVSLDLGAHDILGLVGESGSGKSTLALATLRLLRPPARIRGGQVVLSGVDLLTLSAQAMRERRGRDIAMVFQDASAALNPVLRVSLQLVEAQQAHRAVSRAEARGRAIELLRAVGVAAAEARIDDFPHQLSGGLRQRVCIAMALSCDPKVLVADEPTTALDVTVQAQVLDLLRSQARLRGVSVMFVSHDLRVVARLANRVAVLYSGRVVEHGPARLVLDAPGHPYTRALLASRPRIAEPRRMRFDAIPGAPPAGARRTRGCSFAARCPVAAPRCREEPPPVVELRSGQHVACWLAAGARA